MPGRQQLRYLEAMGIQAWNLRQAPGETGQPAPTVPPSTAMPVSREGESVGALSWEDLSARVSACTACELHKGRTHTVFGTGDRKARWLIIGEAPGAEEDAQGEPFVGRAGVLLNAMIRATGAERDQVYIANIVKCRPPSNRNPRADEAKACATFLARQIELIGPELILAVGRVAASNLLNEDQPLGRLRGRVYKYGPAAIPLVVTYHPAYLLRKPSEKVKAWADLQLAMRVAPPVAP